QFAAGMRRKAEPEMNGRLKTMFDCLVAAPDDGLEWRDHVADDVFRRVMQQRHHLALAVGFVAAPEDFLHYKAMLCNGKCVVSASLAIPTRHSRQAMGNVGDLNVQRGWIKQV